MSVSTEITRILTAKNNIITALNNLNASINSSTTKIDDISDVIDDNYFIPANILLYNRYVKFAYSNFPEPADWIYKYVNSLPNGVILTFMFSHNALLKFVMPENVRYIGKGAFNVCDHLEIMDFSNVDAVIGFTNNNSPGYNVGTTDWISKTVLSYIIVPDNRYDEYYNSEYYVNYKDLLIKKSDYDLL